MASRVDSGFYCSPTEGQFFTAGGVTVTKNRNLGKGNIKVVSVGEIAPGVFCALVEPIKDSKRSLYVARQLAKEYRLLKLFTNVLHLAQLHCTLTNTPKEESNDIGRDGYLMELYQGNLNQMTLATDENKLPSFLTEILEKIALDACIGLKYLHEAGWAHGDFKPKNIFCQYRDGVWTGVLGDFDCIHNLSKTVLLSLESASYGTPYAFSPQMCQLQLEPKKRLSKEELGLKAADAWAAGNVLFFVRYRERPKWTHVTCVDDLQNNVAALTDRAIQIAEDSRLDLPSEGDKVGLLIYYFLDPVASSRWLTDEGGGRALLETETP